MPRNSLETLGRDLERTLQLLEELIAKAGGNPDGTAGEVYRLAAALAARPRLQVLPKVLLKAYQEVSCALGGVRQSRQLIASRTMERLRHTHARLEEVASATESATTAILDGLDRTKILVDQLEEAFGDGGPDACPGARHLPAALRDEVNYLFSCLQFQDITAQQLQALSDVLLDVEQRLAAVMRLLELPGQVTDEGLPAVESTGPRSDLYDLKATLHHASERQALADRILAEARPAVGWAVTGE